MKTPNRFSCVSGSEGSVIVAALLILVIATIIGVAAMQTSSTERQTATNFLLYEQAFSAAETGLEHIKEVLRNGMREPARMSLLATSGKADWSFVLDGDAGPPLKPAATGTDYDHGITWIDAQPLGLYRYTVTIWDNDDGDANPAADADGIILVRSEAEGPRDARCSLEISLDADAVIDSISGYSAQEGSSSGKTFISNDAGAVDFGAPGFGVQIDSDG